LAKLGDEMTTKLKTMGFVAVALIAMIAQAHSFCIDDSVACELHELNDHLQQMQDDHDFDELLAIMDRRGDQILKEIENAKTPEDFALLEKHIKEFDAAYGRPAPRHKPCLGKFC
jgi:hypothetical protein